MHRWEKSIQLLRNKFECNFASEKREIKSMGLPESARI